MILYFINLAGKILLRNKLRSFLTTFGMSIGVFSILVLLSISQGMQESLEIQVNEVGLDIINVVPKAGTDDSLSSSLILDDAYALKERGAHIKYASPVANISATYINDDLFVQTDLKGIDQNYTQVNNLNIKAGRNINGFEVQQAKRVVILGKSIAKSLFDSSEDVLGESVIINNKDYEIIGLVEEGEGVDSEIMGFIPVSTLLVENGVINVDYIVAKANSEKWLNEAEDEIHQILLERHGEEDFEVQSKEDLFESLNGVVRAINVFTLILSFVSFVIGGSSIMTVVSLSITERRREIGVRRAIGALKKHIFHQFLIEGIVLSIIGLLVGISLALGGLFLVDYFTDVVVSFNSFIFLIGAGYSFITGIIFSSIPARKAASYDPMKSLG